VQELTVRVDGLTFSGTRGPFAIGKDGFDGWDDGVTWRVPEVERPNAHGYYDLPSYMNPRTISITGYALAESSRELRFMRSRLVGLLAGGSTGRIQVSRDGWTEWADCKVATEGIAFDEVYGQNYANFMVQLWCPNPLKYGDVNTFTVPSGASYVTVFHRGNAVGYPSIVVSGSMPGGYVLQSTGGAEYRVTTPLTSGNPHTIDMATGLLVRGGLVVSGGVTRADLWRVQGGSTATNLRLQPITTGTGTATATLLDTYT